MTKPETVDLTPLRKLTAADVTAALQDAYVTAAPDDVVEIVKKVVEHLYGEVES